jgi:hypothetical protein
VIQQQIYKVAGLYPPSSSEVAKKSNPRFGFYGIYNVFNLFIMDGDVIIKPSPLV